MAKPNVLILRAPGTNCDQETAFAFEKAGAATEILHVNRLLENPTLFERFQILCIPGGFSYGDDVAAGRILANQMEHHLAEEMKRFKDEGKLILGICNGFQVLVKSGVLLDPVTGNGDCRQAAATLTWNDTHRFDDRWVELGVDRDKCVFLKGVERMYLPIAHAEGKFVACDENEFARLDAEGQLVLRYRPLDGSGSDDFNAPVPYPANPNGSMGNVAGVCDATGRVLGLMPHPERHIEHTHHPR
jgi:phosphoribosylformylglycinamidine synthase